jgi:hypothetical protein
MSSQLPFFNRHLAPVAIPAHHPVPAHNPEVKAWIANGGIAQIDPENPDNVPDWLKRARARVASGVVIPSDPSKAVKVDPYAGSPYKPRRKSGPRPIQG